MKKKKMGVVFGLIVCALAAMLAFAACDSCGKKPEPAPTDGAMLTFVAVDKSNFDKEITFTPNVAEGQTKYTYTYKLALKLNDGGKMEFKGTCTKKEEPQQGGNQGGGMPFAMSVQRNAEAAGDAAPSADLSAYDFKAEGTWTEENGYGYTLTFASEDVVTSGKVVHTNFDTITGRHYFYADIAPTIAGVRVAATTIEFNAKDSAYMKKLASDYKTYEERNATHAFKGGSGRTTVTIYLLPEGKVHMYTESGDSKTVVGGASWTENAANHEITLTVGNKKYPSAYCDTTGKTGYRITYGGADCYTNTSVQYTNADFEGTTLYEFTGSYSAAGGFPGQAATVTNLTLALTSKGLAVVRNASTQATVATGKYTKTGDAISVDMGAGSVEVTGSGSNMTVTVEITVTTQRGPNVSETKYDVEFTGGAVAA